MKTLVTILALGTAALITSCAPAPVVSLHQPGWRVPTLSAPDQSGKSLSLKSRTSGPWAIVFFYPKADTPG